MEFNFSDNDYYEKYPPSFGNGTDLNMHLALIYKIEAKPTNMEKLEELESKTSVQQSLFKFTNIFNGKAMSDNESDLKKTCGNFLWEQKAT